MLDERTVSPTTDQGSVRDFVSTRDSARVLELWRRVFPTPTSGITPEWEFRDGPLGPQPRAVAERYDQIVAHAGVVPVKFQFRGSTVLGAYSVAAMTDAAARGCGVYTRVARHLYSRLERAGFAFVAGFSNRNSVKITTGPLGRVPLRPFPWGVRLAASVGRLPGSRGCARSNARVLGGVWTNSPLELEEGIFGYPELDELWRRVSPVIRIGAVRDAQFNQWRFTGHPHGVYYMRWGRAKGKICAYWVGRIFVFRRIKIAFLVDFLADPQLPEAGLLLLEDFRQWSTRNGAWFLSALLPFHSPVRELLLRFGFVRLPELLHPHRFCFSVRGLGNLSDRPEIGDANNWFLSWADTDTV